jgi:hypothetical protein
MQNLKGKSKFKCPFVQVKVTLADAMRQGLIDARTRFDSVKAIRKCHWRMPSIGDSLIRTVNG